MLSLIFGMLALIFLIYLPKVLQSNAVQSRIGSTAFMTKALPLSLVVISIAAVYFLDLKAVGIKTVGEIPSGFPRCSMPYWNLDLVITLLPGAAMIAMISFVESLSIAQATALQQRSHLNSNQELIALGLSNLSAGLSSAFPVTGSLSRTVVNADAGAKTPLAGSFHLCLLWWSVFILPAFSVICL